MLLPIRKTEKHLRIAWCILLFAAIFGNCGCQSADTIAPAAQQRTLADTYRRPLVSLWPAPGQWDITPDPAMLDLSQSRKSSFAHRPGLSRRWGQMVHRIRRGDTLYRLAVAYYGDARHWRLIYNQNRSNLTSPDKLPADELIFLPTTPLKDKNDNMKPSRRRPDYYIAAPGDTLYKIAAMFLGDGNKHKQLFDANSHLLTKPTQLAVGMMLTIPAN